MHEIHLTGDIDRDAAAQLEDGYAAARAAGADELRLDFTDTTYINSTGIALIVGVLGRARADRMTVSARGLSDHYREIFEITRLADFLTIIDHEGADHA
jgi:anti-sigma B factor antagonist